MSWRKKGRKGKELVVRGSVTVKVCVSVRRKRGAMIDPKLLQAIGVLALGAYYLGPYL